MKKILAVDDQQDILFTLEAIAEVADLNLKTTASGLDALKQIKNNKFDLLLVDYHMPDINGLKLVKKIRKINEEITILVLTVDESLDLAEKFLEAGADDFANKPIKTADLISRIKLHLSYSPQLEHKDSAIKDLDIPKGMTLKTLSIIFDYLKEKEKAETISQISAGTNLAYQTVHRYLNYLNDENLAKVKLNYGQIGRPVHHYQLTSKI
ncbi:response regulator [Halanaerobium praevalens]|uniref:Stage 0 sporulation protein A homolog n=1 Tax=Halanaerobium praevalens (strain ATCC 33744 / DSM 2228 / GSL) TaxID=572479 RepID=E3DP67_HALPG|nr:response regulator [Halanaerobium praevalens]ADO76618.1 response regulator receiver and unknown domain protein [Halanaerobium praevalens DSM 2228]